jgi:hypothetical protein
MRCAFSAGNTIGLEAGLEGFGFVSDFFTMSAGCGI